MKKNSIFLLIFMVASNLIAQQFNKSATLSTIKTDGLHTISITPQVRSFSNIDLSDLRIYNTNNKEVPYYIYRDSKYKSTENFEEFGIVSKEILPQKSTVIIIENRGSKVIDEILLNIVNSKLIKSANVSGSNDQKQWFGLVDKYKLSDLENIASTHVFIPIYLPKTNYRYFKFQIDDTKNAPIDFIKFGVMKYAFLSNKLLAVKPASLTYRTDISQKKTQIVVNFTDPQIIDNLDFQITNPTFYKREARILAKTAMQNKKKKKETYLKTLAEFKINSTETNNFDLPTIFEKEITIEIDNQDNPALEISNINFNQLPVFIVADLKANMNYYLKTGNSTLMAPNYDINNFKNSTISTLPTTTILEIKTIKNHSLLQNENESFWQKKWFLWLCIIIAALAIFYFSTSLLKEMK